MGNQTEPTGRYGFFNLTGIEQHVFIVIIGVVIINQLISWICFDRFEMLTENQIIDFAMELFQQLLMVLEILRFITKPQLDPILIFDL